MTAALRFDPIRLPPECEKLRREVRAFLADEIAAGTFDPQKPNREDTDAPEFSRRVGARGWLGMTWPKKYGGHERSFLERYVVTEEMRVANAPTRRVGDAHFLGDDITLEKAALVAAIFFRPCHAEPAARADAAGKFRRIGIFAVGLLRIEGAGGDLVGKKGAHFLAQHLAFGGKADRIETEGCGHVASRFSLFSA